MLCLSNRDLLGPRPWDREEPCELGAGGWGGGTPSSQEALGRLTEWLWGTISASWSMFPCGEGRGANPLVSGRWSCKPTGTGFSRAALGLA